MRQRTHTGYPTSSGSIVNDIYYLLRKDNSFDIQINIESFEIQANKNKEYFL